MFTEQVQDAAERLFALQNETLKIAVKQWETTLEAQKAMTDAIARAWKVEADPKS